jgi:hypothetical protein
VVRLGPPHIRAETRGHRVEPSITRERGASLSAASGAGHDSERLLHPTHPSRESIRCNVDGC